VPQSEQAAFFFRSGGKRHSVTRPMSLPGPSEVERIRAAYSERDAVVAGSSAWLSLAYCLRMQELERTLLESLRDAGVDPLGTRVLEVGCGTGYFLSRFLDYGAVHVAGIDLMEQRVALARGRDPRLELVAGDASKLPWDDGSFDVVTQFTCLSSVLDPDLREAIAGEMWRVLRPGGTIVSYDMSGAPIAVRALRWAAARRRRGQIPAATPTTSIPRVELERLFPAAPVAARRVTLGTDIAALAERSHALSRLLGALPFLRTHLLAIARRP
jgi:ubiquinone/menaquinone biosynthesis C-methylase UbiE